LTVSSVGESVLVAASLAETWDHYFDERGWRGWVEGLEAVVSSEGYPEIGGTLRWRSNPAGRGEVTERVLEHEPRRSHRVAFTDPQAEGELAVTFAIEGDGTRVTQELSYELRSRAALGKWLTDRLFVRSQVRGSLQRSLSLFKAEVEERAATGESPAGTA
jgi:hypothetical protein